MQAIFPANQLDEVRREARRILEESGPPPGPHWFLVLLVRANQNIQRRQLWNRRSAA